MGGPIRRVGGPIRRVVLFHSGLSPAVALTAPLNGSCQSSGGPRRFLTGRERSCETEAKTNTIKAKGVGIRRYTSPPPNTTPPRNLTKGLQPLRVGRGRGPSVIVHPSVTHVPDVLVTLRYSCNHQRRPLVSGCLIATNVCVGGWRSSRPWDGWAISVVSVLMGTSVQTCTPHLQTRL